MIIDSSVFVNEINIFSDGKLNRKSDLRKLFYILLENHQENTIEEICFTAKYVMGLIRVLKAGIANSEINSLEHVKKDFTTNMVKITEQLKSSLAFADEESRKYFEDEYLQMTQAGLKNLNLLLADLEWTKKYLNNQKRQKN